ncbi:hypothetical protein GCM10025868_35240 [Angustibacter aerolatus]|uniref:Secreted protein n=1 Tax=Angustibacter aerolatus TaxID=1162965 RepID=A0ABQ6JK71_9ACTN|nr:hypothetical protein GCM10025868_35240 [Angustibacter aerolatus]
MPRFCSGSRPIFTLPCEYGLTYGFVVLATTWLASCTLTPACDAPLLDVSTGVLGVAEPLGDGLAPADAALDALGDADDDVAVVGASSSPPEQAARAPSARSSADAVAARRGWVVVTRVPLLVCDGRTTKPPAAWPGAPCRALVSEPTVNCESTLANASLALPR